MSCSNTITVEVQLYTPRPGDGYRTDEVVAVSFSNHAGAILTREAAVQLAIRLIEVASK